jgi:hypothetical protein
MSAVAGDAHARPWSRRLRLALVAAGALYLLQGVPSVSLIALGLGSSATSDVFTVIPYWTSRSFFAGALLFGLALVAVPATAPRPSRAVSVWAAVSATTLYALAVTAWAAWGARTWPEAWTAISYLMFFMLLSVLVAAMCATWWVWRSEKEER